MRGALVLSEGNLSQEMVKRGFVGNCGGAEIIRVAPVRLPQGAAFLLVHKDAIVAPKQVEEYKIHSDAVGYSGDVIEGRIIYDCFVLNEKAAGVYYHGGQGVVGMADVRSAATAAGRRASPLSRPTAARSRCTTRRRSCISDNEKAENTWESVCFPLIFGVFMV